MLHSENLSYSRINFPHIVEDSYFKVDVDDSEDATLKALCNYVDPSTGFPVDSLSRYLSDKTPPEVKDFLKRTLLQHSSSDELSTDGMTDEEIAWSLPNGHESIGAYERRIMDAVDAEKQGIERRAYLKEKYNLDV